MATNNLSDEDIEALKREVKKTTRTTLIIERITLIIAGIGLLATLALAVAGTLMNNGSLILVAILLGILSLWTRSGIAQDRIKRLEIALALHLLGENVSAKVEVE